MTKQRSKEAHCLLWSVNNTFSNGGIYGYNFNDVFDDYCVNVANCLYELFMIRDNVFTFSGDFHMSSCDLIDNV